MSSTDSADRDLIIDEDDPADGAPRAADLPPWRVLIVDDDVDVHVVTKFALSNASFQGRRLCFLHAYSGKEAMSLLRKTPDIALVLLDVIMETDDAGLRVAHEIRSVLHNELTRVVLRTGQPGQALEHSIIVDYDINDFWCKTDLTTRKLFTTVISSLRSYAGLLAAAQARDAMNAALAQLQNVQAAVNQHALLLTLDGRGKIVDANEKLCELAGQSRQALLGRELHALHRGAWPQPLARDLLDTLTREGRWVGEIVHGALTLRCTVQAFKDAEGNIEQYVAVGTVIPAALPAALATA